MLNFGVDATTKISTTDFTNDTNKAGTWYSLNGLEHTSKPKVQGIYIHDGKKVVVK